MIRKPFSILMILLLALLLAAPALAAPPDKGGLAIASVLNVSAPVVFAVQKAENVQEITFYKNFTVDSYTAMETAAVFSVRTEFSLEYSETMLTSRPIGKDILAEWGGGELFSSGYIV